MHMGIFEADKFAANTTRSALVGKEAMSNGVQSIIPEANSHSYNVTPEELFDLFGKFGPIRYTHPSYWRGVRAPFAMCILADILTRQIRQGINNSTKGTVFVVYEDVVDAKAACDKLNGFNFQGRYLVVLYHQPEKTLKAKEDLSERQENLEKLKKEHNID
ncbi:MAG: hypothetical protein Q9159_004169 [Coniocarpon cinnabarinum]